MTEDLVQKMMQLLTPEQKQELAASLLAEDKPKEAKPPESVNRDVDDFTMTRDKPKPSSTQVEVKQRVNLFTDDGTEHKDEQNKTPDITPTERKRKPVKMVSQFCAACNSSVEVHPQHARDFFTCDKCLRARSV
tara:strand:+ start:6909 stop:7310 length:402 start_codon:yes stop_codon:yes gene_type:complete